MAFRRGVLLSSGGFNLDTGRVGRLPLGCEETELCIRVRQADASARVVYEPRATVRHRVTLDRTGWSYLVSRSYFEGVSKAALSRTLGRRDALAAESSYVRTVLPRAVVRELRGTGSGGATRAAAIVVSLGAVGSGYLRGSMRRPVRVGRTPRTLRAVSTAPGPGVSL
jgi:GT2 family glycosyltransferase